MEYRNSGRGRSKVNKSFYMTALVPLPGMSSLGRRFPIVTLLSIPLVCLTQCTADFVSLVRSIFSSYLCVSLSFFLLIHQNTLHLIHIKACNLLLMFLAASRVLVDFFNYSLGYMQLCCGIFCFQEMLCLDAGNVSEVRVRWQGSVLPLALCHCGPNSGDRFPEMERLSLGKGVGHTLKDKFKIRWFV